MFEIDEHEMKFLLNQLVALQILNSKQEESVSIEDVIY